jgi:putative membrane protein
MRTSNQIQPKSSIRTSVIKRSGAVLLSAFCLVGMASCDNEDDDPIVDTVSAQDRSFAIASSQFINAQLSLGQLGLDRGEDDSVLEYSTMLVEDNTNSKTELEGIADSRDIEISDGISAEMQAKYDELVLLSGVAFDKAFIQFQLDVLESSKSMFENQIDNGQNFTVKGFADKVLSMVKAHRTEAALVKVEIGLEDL